MERFRQDLLYAQRSLQRTPLFTLAAVITLALGVGATTTMFSVVDGVLLKPLPYPDQDRVVSVAARWKTAPDIWNPMSKPDLLDVAELPGLETAVGHTVGEDVLMDQGTASLQTSARVTSGILAVFGLSPSLGRDLRPEESQPGAPNVILLSHALWEGQFGADPDVLEKSVVLNGLSFQVVGVAPEGFDYPGHAMLWRPSVIDPMGCGRGCRLYQVTGRMAPGVSLKTLREEGDALGSHLAAEYPESNANVGINIRSLADHIVGSIRAELWALMGAVALVLLVACANVANLLLARARTRTGEMAIRSSLGAGRLRLVAQMLTESLVLAAVGGGSGLLLAAGATASLRRFGPRNIPRIDQIGLDGTSVLFTLGLILLVAVVFGLSPALHSSHSSQAGALRTSGRGNFGSRSSARSRQILVGLEMAFSLILLVGSGLLIRTLFKVNQVDPGYRIDGVLRFSLELPDEAYPELAQVNSFYTRLEERIETLPSVAAVGSAYGVPMGRSGTTGEVLKKDQPEPAPGQEHWAALRPVTPGYLEASGVTVARGRGILPSDMPGEVPVALVNQAFVRDNFPDEDPMGKQVRITVDMGFGSPWWTIVGVVPDFRSRGPTEGYSPEIFVPHAQMGQRAMTVVVQYRGGTPPPISTLQSIVKDLDPGIPLRHVESMKQVLESRTARTRFYLSLLAIFSLLSLVLASVGLYGVVAYLVSTRQQEIGVRLALGADRLGIMRMVLREAALPAVGGLVSGIIGALAMARVFQEFLFQVPPRDPLVFGSVSLILLATALASALLPARRASRISPSDSLRME